MTAPRRIRVMYPAGLSPGGAERQLMLLAEHLPRDRFDVSFVLLLGMTEMAREAERSGAIVHALGAPRRAGQSLPTYAARVAGQAAAYVGICRRERYDIVDAWLYLGYGLAAVTRPLSRVPVLVAGRRSLGAFKAGFGPVERVIDGIARRSADAIVANSNAVAEDTIRREGVHPSRVRVIRNGVVIPPLTGKAGRAAGRARIGVTDDGPVVGCVGTFKPGKGQALVARVMATIAGRGPEPWLVFAGDGPERPVVERMTREAGLTRVRFLGTVPDARALYAAFDLLVSASDAEGLPNVLLEAAAAGLPVVATAAGGSPEVVVDGETGLLVPVGDADGLEAGVMRLLADATLAAQMGKAARAHVARWFGVERFIAETAALYEEMHARHGG